MSSFELHIDPAGVAKFEAIVQNKVGDITEEIARDARRLAPVDTGQLVGSIEADRHAGEITVSSRHWHFVEYGTRYMHAQPYLRPAFYQKRELH